MKKKKKDWCPAKRENHENFYRNHLESRTVYWIRYFEKEKNNDK